MAAQATTQGVPAELAKQAAPAPMAAGGLLLPRVVEETTAREKARLSVEAEKFEFQQRRAKLFSKSGLFTQKNLPEEQAIAQAMVKIELGESMGFSPAESLQGIHVISGQTAIAAALRAARMQAAGWTWDIEWMGTEEEPTGCRLWLYYQGEKLLGRDGEQVSVAFTKADAARMITTIYTDGGAGRKRVSILEKDNWQMSPRNMYFARAVTNAQRFYAPAALSTNLLSVEEAQDLDPERGREVVRGSISLEHLKPSDDPNRGHNGTLSAAAEETGASVAVA